MRRSLLILAAAVGGAVLSTFQFTDTYSVNFGDIMATVTGRGPFHCILLARHRE